MHQISKILHRILPVTVLLLVVMAYPAQAQSESTKDWPAWKQVGVGILAASSVLTTIAVIGIGNAETDSGGNNEGSSEGSSDNSSEGNPNKGQGFVEEVRDELLVFVANPVVYEQSESDLEAIARYAKDYPALMSYYRDLHERHPEVIAAADQSIDGATLIDRLNTVMLVHLFNGDGVVVD